MQRPVLRVVVAQRHRPRHGRPQRRPRGDGHGLLPSQVELDQLLDAAERLLLKLVGDGGQASRGAVPDQRVDHEVEGHPPPPARQHEVSRLGDAVPHEELARVFHQGLGALARDAAVVPGAGLELGGVGAQLLLQVLLEFFRGGDHGREIWEGWRPCWGGSATEENSTVGTEKD